jgi:hypothetical protein
MTFHLFQVYVIMCKFDTGKAIPCCWALLPNKTEDAYQLMMDAIMKKVNRDGLEDHKPSEFSVDFESTMIKIIKARFPGSKITGCTFHMRQAVWRKLQEIGLIPFFFNDADFQELVYMIYALSFVPMDKIVDYYEEVILQRIEDKVGQLDDETGDGIDTEDDDTTWKFWLRQLDVFVAYLDFTWIGKKAARSGRRGRPHISTEVWNHYETMVESDKSGRALCLTNNSLERYNRTLKKMVGSHPNVWLFTQSLISQEADYRRVLMHNATGVDITVNQGQVERIKDNNDRIMCVVRRCSDLSPTMYLQTLSRLLCEK